MPPTLDISEARARLSTLDRELSIERPIIMITRHNRQAFAVVDVEYLETVMETMEVLSDPESAAMLQASVAAIEKGDLLTQEEVERDYL